MLNHSPAKKALSLALTLTLTWLTAVPAWADPAGESSVPRGPEARAPQGHSADSDAGSVPPGVYSQYGFPSTRIEGDQDIELDGGPLVRKDSVLGASQGYQATAHYRFGETGYGPSPDPFDPSRERKFVPGLRGDLSLNAGYLEQPAGSSKRLLVGTASAQVDADRWSGGIAYSLDPRFERFEGSIGPRVYPGSSGRHTMFIGLGTEMMVGRAATSKAPGYGGLAFHVQGESYVSPHFALSYGAQAGFLHGASDEKMADDLTNIDRESAYIKARLSTNRNKHGAQLYVEPAAVAERIGKISGPDEMMAGSAVTATVSVGIAGAGL